MIYFSTAVIRWLKVPTFQWVLFGKNEVHSIGNEREARRLLVKFRPDPTPWEPFKQCCGSGMFIPDPGSDFLPSRIRTVSIPDTGSASKYLSILTPKKPKKWFLSTRKYDPGCSSRIPDPDADFYPSRIQGSKRHRIPDPDPQHCL